MEHLTKQQIVLLTLLVSFVTSIATGIVTVSLLGQAPVGVTQTINRVVERTIERVVADSSKPSTAKDATNNLSANVTEANVDPIVQAVAKVNKSLVTIKPRGGSADSATGYGLIMSKQGIFVTDKAAVATQGSLIAVTSDGKEYPFQVVQSQTDGDIVFAALTFPPNFSTSVIIPVSPSSDVALGQTVFAFSGKNANALKQGIVTKLPDPTNVNVNQASAPVLNIVTTDIPVGSPFFTAKGEVVGMRTTSSENSLYPLTLLKANTPVLSH